MRKVTWATKIGIRMLCAALLLADLLPVTALANNGIVNEVTLNDGIMNLGAAEIQKEAITLEDFIWPNDQGQYSYTLNGVSEGKKYLLMVIPGVYKSLEGLTKDEIVSSLLYLDQQTASGSSVEFHGFIPARHENCTVLVSGEGMPVSIAGYLSKDIYSFGLYIQDEETLFSLVDSVELERNSTWESLLSLLPQKTFMEIYSDYADTLYCPMTIQWRECAEFKTTKIGHMFRVIGDVVPENPSVIGGFGALCEPVVVNVTVVDNVRIPVAIVASKEKIAYSAGSVISDKDVYLKLLFSDGSTQPVTGWTSNVSELSTEEVGTQTLEICYTYQERTFTTQMEIYVTDYEEEVLHQISFETFGGSNIKTILVKDGERITLLEEPEKTGYVFAGWYMDRYRRLPFSGDMLITKDTKLYAGWISEGVPMLEEIDVALQEYYFTVGNHLEKEMISVYANYDDGTKVKVENFETNLYTIDQDTIGKKVLEVSYASGQLIRKKDVEFHILSANGNEFVTVSFETGCDSVALPQTIAYGGTITVPNVEMEKTDAVFAGWYHEGKKWDFEKNTVKENITLEAKWLQKYGEENLFTYAEELSSYEYTGKAIKPEIVVMDKNMNILTKGKDYSISYSNNINPSAQGSSASAVITGKGKYTGGFTMKFTILPKNIEGSDVSATCTEFNLYKEKGYAPIPVLKYGSKKLKNGTDYTVQYYKSSIIVNEAMEEEQQYLLVEEQKLTEVGNYRIVIEGKGNYIGTKNLEYRILNTGLKNLSSAKIVIDSKARNLVYTGNEQRINSKISVKIGKTLLTEGVDYEVIYPENITDIGKKTVTINALPSSTICYGKKTASYQITGLAISGTSVVLKEKSLPYQSAYISDNIKSITIKASKKNKDILQAAMKRPVEINEICHLMEGRDYQITYRQNEGAGKATVTIVGMGFFSGKVTKNFTIEPMDFKNGAVTVSLSQDTVVHSKAGAVVKAKVFFQDMVLKEGRDYIVKYSNNKKIGTGKVQISGKGNFKGSIKQSFNIVPKSLNAKDIKVVVTNPLEITGAVDSTEYKPKIQVMDQGLPVSEKEYLIEYTRCVTQTDLMNNSSIGYITLKEKEGSNYSESRIVGYRVLSNSIETANCTFEVKEQTYTGRKIVFDDNNETDIEQITGKIVLGNGTSRTLILGEDFEVIEYKNNLNPGTATIKIRGIGDFTGVKKLTFKIQKCKL